MFTVLCMGAAEESPILRWLVNPAASTVSNPALRDVLPDVHAVRVDGRYVVVESAGLSLQSLGALEANDRDLLPGVRKLSFRFPLNPVPAEGRRTRRPAGIVGAFLNGVPFYAPVSAASYHGQDLWHRNAVALRQQSNSRPPLLESLLASNTRHSPLIGFALDGYPVYGPYGWSEDGTVRHFTSSYRLRSITRRTSLPDGTELTPSQEGPDVGPEFPVGTFVEDYEYVPGSGDLDQSNGRFARTPEYPHGTYAYFLSTGERKELMYPYLAGETYYGQVEARTPSLPTTTQHRARVDFTAPAIVQAGQPSALDFAFRDARGNRIRFLERVHEQPVHLIVVSEDLSQFAHIHPVLQPDDTFQVDYTFPAGGTYWLFADHTAPGEAHTVSRFSLAVKGAFRRSQPFQPDSLIKTSQGLRITLTLPDDLRAGGDLDFRFDIADAATGRPVSDLDPFLGAWAHFMILSRDRRDFIHAHPVDDPAALPDAGPWQHTHASPGPSPSATGTTIGFKRPGLYRLWAQFQRHGQVITASYTFEVKPGKATPAPAAFPPGAIRVRVGEAGFDPPRIAVAAGQPIKIAFYRENAQNCVNSVVFPELGIRKTLPAGGTVVIEIPPAAAREYHFACGMNMYRGSLVIR